MKKISKYIMNTLYKESKRDDIWIIFFKMELIFHCITLNPLLHYLTEWYEHDRDQEMDRGKREQHLTFWFYSLGDRS